MTITRVPPLPHVSPARVLAPSLTGHTAPAAGRGLAVVVTPHTAAAMLADKKTDNVDFRSSGGHLFVYLEA